MHRRLAAGASPRLEAAAAGRVERFERPSPRASAGAPCGRAADAGRATDATDQGARLSRWQHFLCLLWMVSLENGKQKVRKRGVSALFFFLGGAPHVCFVLFKNPLIVWGSVSTSPFQHGCLAESFFMVCTSRSWFPQYQPLHLSQFPVQSKTTGLGGRTRVCPFHSQPLVQRTHVCTPSAIPSTPTLALAQIRAVFWAPQAGATAS